MAVLLALLPPRLRRLEPPQHVARIPAPGAATAPAAELSGHRHALRAHACGVHQARLCAVNGNEFALLCPAAASARAGAGTPGTAQHHSLAGLGRLVPPWHGRPTAGGRSLAPAVLGSD